VRQMLEPATLAEFHKNVSAQENRAVFEIPEIIARLLDATSEYLSRNNCQPKRLPLSKNSLALALLSIFGGVF